VDVNTASVELLTYVSGLNKKVATHMIALRDKKGAFSSRDEFKKVKGVGPKVFEQAAGFLRILDGNNPLDASAVHPESYLLVETLLQTLSVNLNEAVGQQGLTENVDIQVLVKGGFGEQTVKDVLAELEKPGRDPRPAFKTAKFKSGVHEIRDLRVGMSLEGVVSNVTNFGAFVDIGVHQDGLVHISALADQFVGDPRKVVKTGQVVKVKVSEVDVKRKRISLTMRLHDKPLTLDPTKNQSKSSGHEPEKVRREKTTQQQVQNKLNQKSRKHGGKTQVENAFAAAFAKALEK